MNIFINENLKTSGIWGGQALLSVYSFHNYLCLQLLFRQNINHIKMDSHTKEQVRGKCLFIISKKIKNDLVNKM